MDIPAIMEAECEAITAEGVLGGILPYAAVADLTEVARTPTRVRDRHPCHFEPLPGRGAAAQVQVCPGLGYRFLWCHADNDDYRDDYLRHANASHAAGLAALPATHHVDHLFNRERARELGLAWIRMVLLPAGVNTSHGAGYEKARTRGLIGRPHRQRTLDEITYLKLCGVRTPRKGMPLSPEAIAHARRVAARFGLTPEDILRNIRDLMEVAAFRPGEEP